MLTHHIAKCGSSHSFFLRLLFCQQSPSIMIKIVLNASLLFLINHTFLRKCQKFFKWIKFSLNSSKQSEAIEQYLLLVCYILLFVCPWETRSPAHWVLPIVAKPRLLACQARAACESWWVEATPLTRHRPFILRRSHSAALTPPTFAFHFLLLNLLNAKNTQTHNTDVLLCLVWFVRVSHFSFFSACRVNYCDSGMPLIFQFHTFLYDMNAISFLSVSHSHKSEWESLIVTIWYIESVI